MGLFSLLDEESKFPQATDATLLDKLSHNLAKRDAFKRPKGNQPVFTVMHYAGPVSATSAPSFLFHVFRDLCVVLSVSTHVCTIFMWCAYSSLTLVNSVQVTYDVVGFLEKNRDTLSANLLETMRNSEAQMVCDLFTAPLSSTGALQIK